MAVFKIEPKNKIDIDKKPRVYFACHPDDFEKYFKKVCDDIFKTHDCAIYYTEDMTESLSEEEKEFGIGRNNLFVIPVTYKLLSTQNRAMDVDFPYARKEHIPILPIVMEPGIGELCSKHDEFGSLHYLNACSKDITEIPYEEKLRKHLEAILISDELARRVRDAFEAQIFLSYRKIDRKYANDLIRLIHSYPTCRDIAIWFDEFLTLGESFDKNIEKALNECQLFTLLVTCNIFEKTKQNGEETDNYVIKTELPLALKNKEEKGTDILAVEMEKTNKDYLYSVGITDCVNYNDDEFRLKVLDAVSKIANPKEQTPEHNYLIGLAYLNGIDVEVDIERGRKLITTAAEDGLVEAMVKLVNIYSEGKIPDYNSAILWQKRIVDYVERSCDGKDKPVFNEQYILANLYSESGDYNAALKLYKEIYDRCCKLFGEEDEEALVLLRHLAGTYLHCGHHKKSVKLNKKAYELHEKKFGETHINTLISLSNLGMACSCDNDYKNALIYQKRAHKLLEDNFGEEYLPTIIALDNIADTLGKLGEYREALTYRKKSSSLFEKTLGPEHFHTLIARDNLASSYCLCDNPKRAFRIRKEVYSLFCKVLGATHPETLLSLNCLAGDYCYMEEYDNALQFYKQSYEEHCKALGEMHPNTLMALNGIGYALGKLDRHHEALESRNKEYNLRCKVLGPDHKETLVSLNNVACSYGKLGNYDKALTLHKKAYELRRKTLGENHIDTKESLQNIKDTEALLMLIQRKNNKKKT